MSFDLTFLATKSAAKLLVRPITAALVVPYANLDPLKLSYHLKEKSKPVRSPLY